ncbi:MAG: efflux RND transporter permease subunit, partial [Victivallales bacterium]|nr:efflux RND transporter permease subunit [Victivallales bacterium]
MFLADASTKRPVAMSCLLIALVGLGLNSYRKMSLENLPSIDVPYVTIITEWVGAIPADIEKDVAKRIDDAVGSLDGLKHIESQCMENVCQTTLEFNMGVDVDVAAVDVREKIDKILEDLPEDCERPVIEKINVNATAVVKLAITGDATLEEKYDYADNTLADEFSTLKGVGRVDIISGNQREVHIELDRGKLT